MKISKNSTAKYYQNNKERLQKNLVKDTKVLLKKKMKNEQYRNLPEDEKENPFEYRKKYHKRRKSTSL